MPHLSGPTIIEIQDAYATSQTSGGMQLGQKAVTKDGKTFRWAKVGASTPLVAGNVLQSPANDTNFNGMAVQANVAAGATVIPVTLGGTATTAGMFAGGTLTVRSGTSMLGYTYTIVSHDVANAAATCNFTVLEPVLVALTTSATVTVRKNPYDGVIQSPATTLTGTPVGVAPQVMAVSTYGWIQTGGPCAVLTADTTAVGLSLMVPSGTAGAAIAQTAGNIIIGQTMEVAAAGVTTMVNLSMN